MHTKIERDLHVQLINLHDEITPSSLVTALGGEGLAVIMPHL